MHEFEIQQFRGRTAPFLEPPAGQPTTNILRMAKEGLFIELRNALTEAKATREPVAREHLHVFDRGVDNEFTLRVVPVTLPHSRDGCLPGAVRAEGLARLVGRGPRRAIRRRAAVTLASLRAELAATKQYLQSIVDQEDAATSGTAGRP